MRLRGAKLWPWHHAELCRPTHLLWVLSSTYGWCRGTSLEWHGVGSMQRETAWSMFKMFNMFSCETAISKFLHPMFQVAGVDWKQVIWGWNEQFFELDGRSVQNTSMKKMATVKGPCPDSLRLMRHRKQTSKEYWYAAVNRPSVGYMFGMS